MRLTFARKRRLKNAGLMLLNLPLIFIIILPLIYTLCISVMPADEIYDNVLIPSSVSFDNYVRAFTNPAYSFLGYIKNSFITSITVMLAQMLTCSLAAFRFFLDFKKNVLFI